MLSDRNKLEHLIRNTYHSIERNKFGDPHQWPSQLIEQSQRYERLLSGQQVILVDQDVCGKAGDSHLTIGLKS